MMSREYGDVVFSCDGCDGEIRGTAFGATLAELRERGWTIVNVGDDWEHYCTEPLCQTLAAQAIAAKYDRPPRLRRGDIEELDLDGNEVK